jgi:hypothetical protein
MGVHTVVVACKVPNGLILRLHEIIEQPEPVMGGGTRMVKVAVQKGDAVKIKGPTGDFGQPRGPTKGGFALTRNIPAAFWSQWLKQNRDLDIVKNGLVFAHTKPANTEAQARDHRTLKSGLEPIIPDTDHRIPKGKRIKLETHKRDDDDG